MTTTNYYSFGPGVDPTLPGLLQRHSELVAAYEARLSCVASSAELSCMVSEIEALEDKIIKVFPDGN